MPEEQDFWLELQIEAATGRFLQFRAGIDEGWFSFRPAEGAFANLVREVAAATAGHTNVYAAGHGLSTGLGFLAMDLIQSPLIERLLLEEIEKSVPPERRLEALARCAVTKLCLAQVRQDFDQAAMTRIFEPVDRLFSSSDDDDDAESLSIPQPPDQPANLMAGVCANALAHYDAVAPRNSWPWVLLREATFVLANQGRYTQTELEHLLKSNTLGPVGCLSTAVLVGDSRCPGVSLAPWTRTLSPSVKMGGPLALPDQRILLKMLRKICSLMP